MCKILLKSLEILSHANIISDININFLTKDEFIQFELIDTIYNFIQNYNYITNYIYYILIIHQQFTIFIVF
jgi:hypothetical protein